MSEGTFSDVEVHLLIDSKTVFSIICGIHGFKLSCAYGIFVKNAVLSYFVFPFFHFSTLPSFYCLLSNNSDTKSYELIFLETLCFLLKPTVSVIMIVLINYDNTFSHVRMFEAI